MPEHLRIDNCHECPHRSHSGGYGAIAYVPTCTAAKRDLPYSVSCAGAGRSVIAVAHQTPGIPSWCPLQESNE